MLRMVTRRFWVLIAVLLAGYGVLGYFFAENGPVSTDVWMAGLLLEVLAPLVFTGVYTYVTRGGWSHNDLGVNLVLVELGLLPQAGILAYVVLFRNGAITTSGLAWAFIGSPYWTAGMLFWRNFIYLRIRRDERGRKETETE
jgi:hypothetical protein